MFPDAVARLTSRGPAFASGLRRGTMRSFITTRMFDRWANQTKKLAFLPAPPGHRRFSAEFYAVDECAYWHFACSIWRGTPTTHNPAPATGALLRTP